MMVAFSKRCLKQLDRHLALRLFLSLVQDFLDANVTKELKKNRLVIDHAATAFNHGKDRQEIDIGQLFEMTKAIDHEFIRSLRNPVLSLQINHGDLAEVRKKRIKATINMVFDLLGNWQDQLPFADTVKRTYEENVFKEALAVASTAKLVGGLTGKLIGQGAPYPVETADVAWGGWRQFGGWWNAEPQPGTVQGPTAPATLDMAPAQQEGSSTEYPFLLYPYMSVPLGDGSGASQSWLQETPDPMITASWDTRVEINPKTASDLGLKLEDVVSVKSPYGEISAIVYPYPGIRPDVVAVPTGQGHSALGRFATGYGANVLAILAPKATDDGELAWAATIPCSGAASAILPSCLLSRSGRCRSPTVS